MVAYPAAFHLIRRPAALAALAAAGAAVAAALAPVDWFEAAVLASGIAALVPAAEPPLGATARAALIVAAASVAGGGMWLLLRLVAGRARPVRAATAQPSIRREDAHPDAPPRLPVRAARDLGEPMAEPPAAEPVVARLLPTNLDLPLAAFDAHAIPAVPAQPVRPVAPLFRPTDADEPAPAPAAPIGVPDEPEPVVANAAPSDPEPVERIEVFALPHPARDEDVSIEALLARFERGIARRRKAQAPSPATEGLEATLAKLRRMAARA